MFLSECASHPDRTANPGDQDDGFLLLVLWCWATGQTTADEARPVASSHPAAKLSLTLAP
jgi:hypothetical protein